MHGVTMKYISYRAGLSKHQLWLSKLPQQNTAAAAAASNINILKLHEIRSAVHC